MLRESVQYSAQRFEFLGPKGTQHFPAILGWFNKSCQFLKLCPTYPIQAGPINFLKMFSIFFCFLWVGTSPSLLPSKASFQTIFLIILSLILSRCLNFKSYFTSQNPALLQRFSYPIFSLRDMTTHFLSLQAADSTISTEFKPRLKRIFFFHFIKTRVFFHDFLVLLFSPSYFIRFFFLLDNNSH